MSYNRLEEKGDLFFEIPEEVSRRSHSVLFIGKKLIPVLKEKEKLSKEDLIGLIEEYKEENIEADFDLPDLREAADFLYHEKENRVSVKPEELELKRKAQTLLNKIKSLERGEPSQNVS